MLGLAGTAATDAERARRGQVSGTGSDTRPPALHGSSNAHAGNCGCAFHDLALCAGGCGRHTCGRHTVSRLGPSGQRSERERTAFLGAFWAGDRPMCSSCREASALAAVATLPPVAPLPENVVARLLVLLLHSHDYLPGEWDRTVREHGGSAAVVRLAAPLLSSSRTVQVFRGRRSGDVLTGLLIGCSGTTVKHVIDGLGEVWTVRPVTSGVLRKRRSWAWEHTAPEQVAQLLPRILELIHTS